jgi:predicted PurR-regulated permease PerM
MNPMNSPSRDLVRSALQLFFAGVLMAGSFWILQPFLLPLIWAIMIVVATWPLMLRTQAQLGGKRALAVTVMIAALLLILVVPVSLAVVTIVENAAEIVAWSRSQTFVLPMPPAWVATLPVVGSRLAAEWRQIAAAGPEGLVVRILPYVDKIVRWFVAQMGGLGVMAVHFLLTVIIASILYVKGEAAGERVRLFARRLGGPRGENALQLAVQAIRSVALGVIVTAIVQALLAGIGLAVVGVPYVAILTAVMLFLGVAQLGPMPVLIPAVVWLYWKGHLGWGTVLLVWTIVVGTIDNVLRPILIRRGANLPLLLIFAGVIGGLVAFGVIGLFIGPVVLAVSYTLLAAWIQDDEPQPLPEPEPAGTTDKTGASGQSSDT